MEKMEETFFLSNPGLKKCYTNKFRSEIRIFFHNQVSQYTFAMCSYKEKKSEPSEFMQLEGFTVDYAEPDPGLTSRYKFFSK